MPASSRNGAEMVDTDTQLKIAGWLVILLLAMCVLGLGMSLAAECIHQAMELFAAKPKIYKNISNRERSEAICRVSCKLSFTEDAIRSIVDYYEEEIRNIKKA